MNVRIALGLVLAICGGCETEIIHELSEPAANEILATLSSQGIDGEKTRQGKGGKATYTVAVARDKALEAWRVLRKQNLPRVPRRGLGDVFGNPGLVPTATQERALMHHAIAEGLADTLESVEGVVEARVHVVLPSRDPLAPPDAPQPQPKASVLLRVTTKPALETADVQRIVAGAVKDMLPNQVSVVFVAAQSAGKTPSAGLPKTGPVGLDSATSRLGPFTVASHDRVPLLATLVALLAAVLALGVLALLLLRRGNRLAAQRPRTTARGSIGYDYTGASQSAYDGSMGLINQSLGGAGKPPQAARRSNDSY